jgi:magnesium chelatase family protein
MAFSRVTSAQLSGLHPAVVTVEADVGKGLYLFQIVGLPDKAVEESRERVISALKNNCDIYVKAFNEKITVSLSPAELKKEGAYADLAIAIAYLTATERIDQARTEGCAFIGELSLNGELKPVRGIYNMLHTLKKAGYPKVYIPEANKEEAKHIDGITIIAAPTLASVIEDLLETNVLEPVMFEPYNAEVKDTDTDFSDIVGQAHAKRALLISAAGGHNIALFGPPGTGKTLLARAFHSIFPPLENDDFYEVASVYSSVGAFADVEHGAVPLRSPHHSSSYAAIIGGGTSIKPGEITLSHKGILYLDEFPEFDRRVVESLREPLEEGKIAISRASGTMHFPADFILLAAMNPCPCGYRGSKLKHCSCSGADLAKYKKKLSGPIVDRIDLWIEVGHIPYNDLHRKAESKESPLFREKVARVRTLQRNRNPKRKLNTALQTKELHEISALKQEAQTLLERSAEKLKLSPRSYIKTLKLARTIADLEDSGSIEENHILEALQYRPKVE